jgi:hypothetical protein
MEAQMNSTNQTRFLAANYSSLQGLRIVPFGLLLLVVSLWANGQQGPARDLSLPLTFLVILLVCYFAIDRYYRHVYGRVQRSPASLRTDYIITVAAAILALGAFILDSAEKVPISALGLLFALGSLEEYIRMSVRFQSRYYFPYLILSVLLALVSVLPLFGITGFWKVLGIKAPLLGISMVIGAIMILSGILAHIQFVRSLPAPKAAENG